MFTLKQIYSLACSDIHVYFYADNHRKTDISISREKYQLTNKPPLA
jgi:hypothetical protein